MIHSSRFLAEQASFTTFVNCYLREVDQGRWSATADWSNELSLLGKRARWVVELELHSVGSRLALGISYASRTGRSEICSTLLLLPGNRPQPIDHLSALLLLLRELRRIALQTSDRETAFANELELLSRVLSSQQLMSRYIDARRKDERLLGENFIDSEQSLLWGHWFHPTPKSRQGLSDWQDRIYAPELGGRFPLHFFAARRELVWQDSATETPAEQLMLAPLVDGEARLQIHVAHARDEVLLPMHPLQAAWLLEQPNVKAALKERKLRNLGPLGRNFTATSSVRTVYAEDCPFMFKFSVPVRITNSLRACRPHELRAGVSMARLVAQLHLQSDFQRFAVISDVAALNLKIGQEDVSGFEIVVRDNPFVLGREKGIHSIAALAAPGLPHRLSRLASLIEGMALAEGRTPAEVTRDWLMRYWDCAIEPLIRLYDRHGIALEAHQQNSLIDINTGYPRMYFFRDNQGYYLSYTQRSKLTKLVPRLEACPELFYDDAQIRRRFSYYLLCNQLFGVISRLGADGLLDEEQALSLCRRRLGRMLPSLEQRGTVLVQGWLTHATLPYKANLLTRLADVDELTAEMEQAVYGEVENPINQQTTPCQSIPIGKIQRGRDVA